MDNDALIAALGVDAIAATRGYREAVVADAARRGLVLTRGAPPGPTAGTRTADPVDVVLTVVDGRGDLRGRSLRWSPETGWSSSAPGDPVPVRYRATAGAVPLDLVPTAAEVLDWVVGLDATPTPDGTQPPDGVELADDPAALHRLIDFIGPPRLRHARQLFRSPHRAPPTSNRGILT